MSFKERKDAEQSDIEARIQRDKMLSHAVETIHAELPGSVDLSRDIEAALSLINQRALSANMIIITTSITTSMAQQGAVLMALVMVVCQWVEREKLEAMQRQQRLMGHSGGNHHP